MIFHCKYFHQFVLCLLIRFFCLVEGWHFNIIKSLLCVMIWGALSKELEVTGQFVLHYSLNMQPQRNRNCKYGSETWGRSLGFDESIWLSPVQSVMKTLVQMKSSAARKVMEKGKGNCWNGSSRGVRRGGWVSKADIEDWPKRGEDNQEILEGQEGKR